MNENPYQPPGDFETAPQSVSKSLAVEAYRGARLGALVGLTIGVVFAVAAVIVTMFFIPREVIHTSSKPYVFVTALVGIALCAVYGALTGAVIHFIAWAMGRKAR